MEAEVVTATELMEAAEDNPDPQQEPAVEVQLGGLGEEMEEEEGEEEKDTQVVEQEVVGVIQETVVEVVEGSVGVVVLEGIVGERVEVDAGEGDEEFVAEGVEEEEEETQVISTSSSSPQKGSLTCNICEQAFGRQSHLTRHIETCHGERGTHQCSQCTQTFKRKDSLSRHLATQHGENPRRFKCTVAGCDKDFNRKDHLTKHLRGVHKIEPSGTSPVKEREEGDNDELLEEEGGGSSDNPDEITPMITEVSSLVETGTGKDKRYKCTNTGCDAQYPNLSHLHRHLSRAHSAVLQLPIWGHSVFGEMKFEASEEGELTLCMFCCSSYQHNKEIEKQRKSVLASDPHFTKFCEAALRQQRKRMSANSIIKSLNSLNKLSVCQRCFNKIGYAMGTKATADIVEARVAELRRQLDAELKNLQSEVDQFFVEMKQIEDTIRNSDMSNLEGYLAAIESPEEKEQSSVVLLLRDGIFAVMNDVEVYCKRMKGQQIVVSTPQVPKTTAAALAKDKRATTRKRKRKTKHRNKSGINPLLHVKVEHEKGAEDSEKSQTDLDDTRDVVTAGEEDDAAADKSLTFGSTSETPRRQPKREARVRTEEFLKSLFEKQLAADEEELEMVIKTEVPSDTEADAEGVEPGEAMETEEGTAGDKTAQGGEAVNEEKGKEGTEAAVASSSAAGKDDVEKPDKAKITEDKKGDGEEGKEEEAKEKDGKEAESAAAEEAPPIEEILLEGDELEDLFYDEGDTSDEDFTFDETGLEVDSRSESSDSDIDESEEDDSEDEEDDEPTPKRARGRPPRSRSTRRSDYDPFNFKKSRKTRTAKTKSNNKLAQMHNIDMSGMSDFRQRLLLRILKKNNKCKSPPPDPLSSSGERDPRVNFRFEYSKDEGTLVLGDVHVIIHDEHSSLQCSKCGYLSSPAEKPRRSVPRIMYNHILGKHLFAFQCPQCSATLGSYRRYLDHIKGHQMGFMCDICGKPLFSEEALRRHRWGHMNAEEMAEAVRSGIKDPRRKHDPTLTFQCTTCGKVFSKKMLLRQHEKTHAENRERIVCTLCGKTFLPSGFISHQKYSCFPEGYEPPRVQCQLCPSTFKSVVLRARHMKYAHSTASIEKPFKCHLCGKGFAANEHLQKHIKRHSDARPYLCRKGCGANYKTRKDCTRHEKKCEGNGTPMMRHKGRNDQLNAVPKIEPGTEPPPPQQQQPQATPVIQVHPGTPSLVIQTSHSHQPPQQQQQQQFNVYNIL